MDHLTLFRPGRAFLALAAASAIALSTTGCSGLTPGPSSGGQTTAEAGKKLSSDEVVKAGDITLRMSDYVAGSVGEAVEKNIAQFEAKYPNIKIERSTKAFADYGKTIALSLSADNGPDIAQSNVAMARQLVSGRLLKPMNDYYAAYGWDKQYPEAIQQTLRAEQSGKTFGAGDYWGMSLGGNMVGVYYNADKLSKLGISTPTSFDEFQNALATAKEKGEIPLQLGNLEQYPANHVFSTLLNDFEEPKKVADWVNGKAGSTFDTPGVRDALGVLDDWAVKGYIPAQANGTKDNDAAAAFAAGQGVFTISGSWQQDRFDKGLGSAGGFMLMPPKIPGTPAAATGSVQEAFTISAKSKNADIAAFFLDYLAGPESAQNNLAGGYLPFSSNSATTGGTVAKDVLAGWNTVVKDDGLVGYLDSAAPAMGDAMFPALQSLIGDQQSADQVVVTIHKAWTDYHSGS